MYSNSPRELPSSAHAHICTCMHTYDYLEVNNPLCKMEGSVPYDYICDAPHGAIISKWFEREKGLVKINPAPALPCCCLIYRHQVLLTIIPLRLKDQTQDHEDRTGFARAKGASKHHLTGLILLLCLFRQCHWLKGLPRGRLKKNPPKLAQYYVTVARAIARSKIVSGDKLN